MARVGGFAGATAHPFGVGIDYDALYNSNSSAGSVVSTPGPPPATPPPPPGTIPTPVPPPVTQPPTPGKKNKKQPANNLFGTNPAQGLFGGTIATGGGSADQQRQQAQQIAKNVIKAPIFKMPAFPKIKGLK